MSAVDFDWHLEITLAGGGLTQVQRFFFASEYGARATYTRVSDLQRDYRARRNDLSQTVEVTDDVGSCTMNLCDIAAVRVFNVSLLRIRLDDPQSQESTDG